MDFVGSFDELAGAELDVLVVGDGQVVVGLDLCFAVGMGSVVLFGEQFGVTVGFDAVVAFVADVDVLVVLDVLSQSRWAWMKICSSPVLSSMRSSLKPSPPGVLRVLKTLLVLCSGRAYGTWWVLW